jgi:hypothetical protein
MAITTIWIIERMDCYPAHEGQTNVVFNVHWRVNAVDGAYTATSYGTVGVTYNSETPFTPHADLTEAQVVGWVQSAMGAEQAASIEFNLATNIANQMTPPVISPALPWAT